MAKEISKGLYQAYEKDWFYMYRSNNRYIGFGEYSLGGTRTLSEAVMSNGLKGIEEVSRLVIPGEFV